MVLINGQRSDEWLKERLKEKSEFNKNKPCNITLKIVECVKKENKKGGVKNV